MIFLDVARIHFSIGSQDQPSILIPVVNLLSTVPLAIRLPIESYHCWSLIDNFEWTAGCSQRFGFVYVDYADNCKRTIKESGHWYAKTAAANKPA
jgi:Glycosyl hydrolase family 1